MALDPRADPYCVTCHGVGHECFEEIDAEGNSWFVFVDCVCTWEKKDGSQIDRNHRRSTRP